MADDSDETVYDARTGSCRAGVKLVAALNDVQESEARKIRYRYIGDNDPDALSTL
jgi:hypothetical protein